MVVRSRQRQAAGAAMVETSRRDVSRPRNAPARPVKTAQRAVSATQDVPVPRDAPTRQVQAVHEAAAAPRAWFVVSPPNGDAWEAALLAGETTIGRATDSQIWLDDEMVSRQHAVVRLDPAGGQYVYRDLSPTNPSLIDGEEIRGPRILRPDDVLVLGSTTLAFHQDH